MSDNLQPEDKSRSQVKRDLNELKELGKQLVSLPKGHLASLPMSETLREALLAAKTMTRRALQRQYRHLPALMVNEDLPAIRNALARKMKPHADEVAAIHRAEEWRGKLLSDGESQVAAVVEKYPACDRAHLRQLVRNAKKEHDLKKPPRAARLLYKYLRDLERP